MKEVSDYTLEQIIGSNFHPPHEWVVLMALEMQKYRNTPATQGAELRSEVTDEMVERALSASMHGGNALVRHFLDIRMDGEDEIMRTALKAALEARKP